LPFDHRARSRDVGSIYGVVVGASEAHEPFVARSFIGFEQTTVVRRRQITAKTIRLRDKEQCKFGAAQSCIVCGRTQTEAQFVLRNPARLTAKSARNTRCRSAGSIIANYTDMAMKLRGGPESPSTLCPSRSSSGGARGRFS
jgi:hypothetical protein